MPVEESYLGTGWTDARGRGKRQDGGITKVPGGLRSKRPHGQSEKSWAWTGEIGGAGKSPAVSGDSPIVWVEARQQCSVCRCVKKEKESWRIRVEGSSEGEGYWGVTVNVTTWLNLPEGQAKIKD